MKKRIYLIGLAILACTSMSFAQSPTTPPNLSAAPVQVKRIPAAPSLPQPSLLQKYDFGDQLRVLEDPTAIDPQRTSSPAPSNATPVQTATGANKVPMDYQ